MRIARLAGVSGDHYLLPTCGVTHPQRHKHNETVVTGDRSECARPNVSKIPGTCTSELQGISRTKEVLQDQWCFGMDADWLELH